MWTKPGERVIATPRSDFTTNSLRSLKREQNWNVKIRARIVAKTKTRVRWIDARKRAIKRHGSSGKEIIDKKNKRKLVERKMARWSGSPWSESYWIDASIINRGKIAGTLVRSWKRTNLLRLLFPRTRGTFKDTRSPKFWDHEIQREENRIRVLVPRVSSRSGRQVPYRAKR